MILGGHQERGRRGGTENVASIVGLGAAAELALSHLPEYDLRVRGLRDRLEKGILEKCPESRLNGDPEHRLPNTSNLSFRYVQGEAVLLNLDRYGICASTGSACMSGMSEPSHVLRAMNVPFTYLQGSLRLSLSRLTTDAEVDRVLDVLPPIIEQLRALSPYREQETG